jgi:hypothetical protein
MSPGRTPIETLNVLRTFTDRVLAALAPMTFQVSGVEVTRITFSLTALNEVPLPWIEKLVILDPSGGTTYDGDVLAVDTTTYVAGGSKLLTEARVEPILTDVADAPTGTTSNTPDTSAVPAPRRINLLNIRTPRFCCEGPTPTPLADTPSVESLGRRFNRTLAVTG